MEKEEEDYEKGFLFEKTPELLVRGHISNEVSDEEWGRYLFFRNNPKGIHFERWTHDHGCRRWFNVMRDTVSDKILKTYKMGESRSEVNE